MLDGCSSHLWRNVMEGSFSDVCEWEANACRPRGTGSIPPAVFRSSGNLILNGRKVVEMFGVKILNLE